MEGVWSNIILKFSTFSECMILSESIEKSQFSLGQRTFQIKQSFVPIEKVWHNLSFNFHDLLTFRKYPQEVDLN